MTWSHGNTYAALRLPQPKIGRKKTISLNTKRNAPAAPHPKPRQTSKLKINRKVPRKKTSKCNNIVFTHKLQPKPRRLQSLPSYRYLYPSCSWRAVLVDWPFSREGRERFLIVHEGTKEPVTAQKGSPCVRDKAVPSTPQLCCCLYVRRKFCHPYLHCLHFLKFSVR